MTADTIYSSFSECPIAPLEGLPTIDYLSTMGAYLNGESSNIQSDLGNGSLGHMVITAVPAVFALQCPGGYVLPVNPGPLAVIPAGATGPQISVLKTNHDEQLRIWRLHNAVEKACKKVISVLIPERFYRTLKNRYTQFANVTTLTILTHLLTEYGQLSDQAVQDNDALMKKDINGETDFEDLVLQIEDAVENVATQNPYTDQQVVSISFTIVERCGFYHEDCRDWKRKAAADRTWTTFKTHFSRAFKEVRESSSSVRTGGYANLCLREVAERAEAQEAVNNETQIALANFVSAASSDRNTISSLTKTIAELSKELSKANLAIAALTKKLGNGTSTPSGNGGAKNNKKRKFKNMAIDIHGKEREFVHSDNDFYDPKAYCWSHGFRCRIGHDSSTCTYKKEGHVDNATRENTQNGCQTHINWN